MSFLNSWRRELVRMATDLFRASRPLRFLIVGGFNTAMAYVVYASLVIVGVPFWAANFAALIFGIGLSFLTQGRIVFGNRDPRRFWRFLASWLAIYATQTGIIGIMMRYGIDPVMAGLIVLPATAVASYLVQKRVVFHQSHQTGVFRMITLGIVVPCYNEQEVLPETASRLGALLEGMVTQGKISPESGVWLVDDGSKDATWSMIADLAMADPRFHGVKLSRNRGHQNALLAGIETAKGDAIVTVDADLQDDITAIERMVDLHVAGADIVYGVRQSRTTDTVAKRMTAQVYYKLLARMGVHIVYNHADYRLLSRRALEALLQYSEVNLFLRGIIPQLGFTTAEVPYDRAARFAGESKYPLRKMLALAVNGVTSFSVVPLRMIAVLGTLVCLFSFAMILWVLYGAIVLNSVVPGWASSVLPIYLLGGVQLLCIGVIGEYVGKIYLESKRRPRFFIEKEV